MNPTLTRITELGLRLNNADSAGAHLAAANIAAGKPAVWSMASFSHAPVNILAGALNRLGNAKAAIADCNRMSGMHDYGKHPEWLDLIAPLNAPAVHLLADAYVLMGSFRSARELFARCEKLGFAMAEVA